MKKILVFLSLLCFIWVGTAYAIPPWCSGVWSSYILKGTLTNGDWCTTDGTVVNCTSAAPILAETDPIVKAINGVVCSNGSTIAACTNLSNVSYLPLAGGAMTGAILGAKSANIASASTVDL